MIPQRVYVKGFMSYRDETEFRFDGVSLWVLAGRNGAGKSAVFDAITFALYGEHRGGKNNADALINQQSDSLVVEFDFSIGDEEYRVKRTLSRKRSSCQAFLLTGTKAVPQPIPDTNGRTSLEKWSERVIGLSFETFTASVLLQQNKSDLLLSATASKRHEMIAQLIDLSAYLRLHQQIEERYRELERSTKVYQNQLQEIEPIDETLLASLNESIETLGIQIVGSQVRLELLSALKEQSRQWSILVARYAEVDKKLLDTYTILAQAEDIERKANRLAMVNHVLPLLKRLVTNKEQFEEKDVSIVNNHKQIQFWNEKLTLTKIQKATTQDAIDDLKTQQKACYQERDQAQRDILELTPHVQKIEQLKDIRQEIAKLDQALAQFSPDLEQYLTSLQHETDILNILKHALPWLRQYAEARQDWQSAATRLEEAHIKASQITICLATIREEQKRFEERVNAVKEAVQEASQIQTTTKTLLIEAKKHLSHFEEVDGQANCSYCGQPLTMEHLQKERIRLETEVQTAQNAFIVAQQHHKAMSDQQQQAGEEKQHIEKEVRRIEGEERTIQQTLRDTLNTQEQAKRQAENAIKVLPASYKLNIVTLSAEDSINYFANEYPTQALLDTFDNQIALLDEKNAQLSKLRELCDKQRELHAQRSPHLEKIRQMEILYPLKQEQEICARFQRAEDTYKCAEQRQGEVDAALQDADQTNSNVERVLQEAEQNLRDGIAEKNVEEALQKALQKTITQQLSELPDTWQTIASATFSQLQEHVEALQIEVAVLDNADTQYEQLTEARQEKLHQEELKDQIEQDMTQIEQDAHRPLLEIQQEEQDAHTLHTEATNARSKAENEKRRLENRREQRENLEQKRLEAVSKASLYKRLAYLLGPDCLQNHLLLQAQAGIVTYANEILGRISSGTLRIELRQKEEVNERRVRTKTLELVAYNSEVGTESLPVNFLSGSQKFRVAVCLALGIGQYTNFGTRQIESVIIDEGFGSLDKEGRDEMIHELRLLKNVLKRIILVSHQEEVVDAFDNGYMIELVDGASRVSLR